MPNKKREEPRSRKSRKMGKHDDIVNNLAGMSMNYFYVHSQLFLVHTSSQSFSSIIGTKKYRFQNIKQQTLGHFVPQKILRPVQSSRTYIRPSYTVIGEDVKFSTKRSSRRKKKGGNSRFATFTFGIFQFFAYVCT